MAGKRKQVNLWIELLKDVKPLGEKGAILQYPMIAAQALCASGKAKKSSANAKADADTARAEAVKAATKAKSPAKKKKDKAKKDG